MDRIYTGQRITAPGKFEGEPDYVEHYWGVALDGGGDETVYDGETPPFVLTAEDWPVKAGHAAVGQLLVLHEDSQGFVHHNIVSQVVWDACCARLTDSDTEAE